MNGEFVKLTAVSQYINKLSELFERLAEEQDTVSRAYSSARDLWCDKIALLTGESLVKISDTIKRMHEVMSKNADLINRRYEQMSIGYAEREWDGRFGKCEFSVSIMLENNMDMDTINGTTVEGIASFERALAKYIENTSGLVARIRGAHDEVGGFWKGDQYNRVTDSMNDFVKRMNAQLEVLDTLSGWITERRHQFEIALEMPTTVDVDE